MKKNLIKWLSVFTVVLSLSFVLSPVSLAAGELATTEIKASEAAPSGGENNQGGDKAMSAAIAIAAVAAAGALAMGFAIAKSVEGIARQPEAEGKIRNTLMLGLVFVETAIIYALIIAILIIFVL